MQALDNFISPIPGFDGDILIPAIPVSAQPPGDESTSDPSARVSASALKTQSAHGKQLPTQLLKRKPGEPLGDLLVGSKSMNMHPRLLL
jgi:hypothetical protein